MPRGRSPNREKAFELWKKSDGKRLLRDIAEELGVSETMVRKWKNQDGWESAALPNEPETLPNRMVTLPNKPETLPNKPAGNGNVTKRKPAAKGAPKGNQNAAGHGAPKGNQNHYVHGLYANPTLDMIPAGELERLLGIIHELEPAGIGARDLRECLLLQMAQMPVNTRPRRLARKILTSYFDEFVKKHYEKLMARLQISEDDFRDAIAEIRHLSPKPGNLYAEGGTDTTPYIIPDFILDYQDGRFNLSLNSYNVPEVRVNRRYMEMIREMVGSDGRVREKDKEAIQFVKNKIDSAKWFISAIKQRHDTLMRTMQTILDYQQEYFKDGDKSKLRPMILKDIADRTGLDVSTISRVVNSKYVQTQFGIILLKSLFSEAMQTDSGEEVSSYEIKNILQQCIDEEDKRRPLTDETLMDILNSKGYRIARRTVAKYREMLGIPVARLRKQI